MMHKQARQSNQSQQVMTTPETDSTIEALRRQMYERIAKGHAIEMVEVQAKRDQS